MSDWRAYRPAIWLAMLGIALVLLISPAYVGALALGAALGVGWGIHRRRSGSSRRRRPRSG
ncbi:MAG TPA: hypothetical protein VII87_00055 [Solirubrobacteraceae bacterium]